MDKKEFVDRGALIRELHECGIFPVIVRRTIERAPAADVAEVVHGEWIGSHVPDSILDECSICHFDCGAYSFKYCPNCGAKMDGERKEE